MTSLEVTSVGFYDNNNIFFYINDFTGFDNNSLELAEGVKKYIARCVDKNGYSVDKEISKQTAYELSKIFNSINN